MKKFYVRMNGIFLVLYLVLVPVAYLVGWLESKVFISVLSIVALVESRLAALFASKSLDE